MKKTIAILLAVLLTFSSLGLGFAESAQPVEAVLETPQQSAEQEIESPSPQNTGEAPTGTPEAASADPSADPTEPPSGTPEASSAAPSADPTEPPSGTPGAASATPPADAAGTPEATGTEAAGSETPGSFGSSETPAPVVEMAIEPAEATLSISQTLQLTAHISNLPEGMQTAWQSGDESIATVDATGLVTAHQAGDTWIYLVAGEGETFAQCALHVTQPEEEPPVQGYAVSAEGALLLFAEDSLQTPLAVLEADAVFYVLSTQTVGEEEVLSVTVAADRALLSEEELTQVTPEGLLPGFVQAGKVRLLSPEETEAYEQQLAASGQGVAVPGTQERKLLAVPVAFPVAEALETLAGPLMTEGIQVAPLWSGRFPDAFGDAASLAQATPQGVSLEAVLLDAFAGQVEEIDLSGFVWTPAQAAPALQALVDDHPDLIALSGDFQAEVQDGNIVTLRPQYRFTLQETQAHLASLDAYARTLAAAGNGAASPQQKIFWIHNALSNQLAYDGGTVAPEEAAATGAAGSQGFAYLMQRALQDAGIPSSIVRSAGMGRAWNLAQVEGAWYHIDAAAYVQRGMMLDFSYLMASDATLRSGDLGHSGWLARHAAGSDAYAGYNWILLLPVAEDELQLLSAGAVVPVPATDTRMMLRGLRIEDVLLAGMTNQETFIDVQSYGLSIEQFKQVLQDLLNTHPEIFYMGEKYRYYPWTTGGVTYVLAYEPSYKYTGQDLINRIDAFNETTQAIISAVPAGASDLEKALFVNDYFATHYAYDTTYSIHSPDLMFSGGTGVCQAYALGFQHLMNQMGVPCSYATSDDDHMNHIWNLIKVGGNWYHIDTTWNDPVFNNEDILGYAGHDNFMLSETGIRATGHWGWESPYTATSTTYDNYFWRDVESAFAPLNGKWYYTRSTAVGAAQIMMWSGSGNAPTTLYSYPAYWKGYIGCFSGVVPFGGKLLYNTQNALYTIEADGSNPTMVHTPTLQSGRMLTGLYQKTYTYYVSATTPFYNARATRLTNGDIGNIEHAVSGIGLNRSSYDLDKGKTFKLVATVRPATATNPGVIWITSDPSVAKVSSTGIVEGLQPGTAVITATTQEGGFSASCTVRVLLALTPMEQFVYRLYQNVLGRAPDSTWDTWLSGLTSGSETGASAARGFFISQEFEAKNVSNSTFVTLVYNTILDRPPTAGDVAYWTKYLDQGISRTAVLNEIMKNPEFGNICRSYGITRGTMPVDPEDQDIMVTLFVQRLYTIILNRKPDSVGVRHWTNYLLNQGGSGKITAGEFAFSREFTNMSLSDEEFVRRMYRALLNREPEPEGLQGWLTEIRLHGREEIFNGFAGSPEFAQIMAIYGVR